MPNPTPNTLEKIESMVVHTARGCWVWFGPKARGYGHISYQGKKWRVHRLFYERHRGAIPTDRVIDHLCRNRSCVNPAHMELVTATDNTHRGVLSRTHCKRGHILAGMNLRIRHRSVGRIERVCRTCSLLGTWRYRGKAGREPEKEGKDAE